MSLYQTINASVKAEDTKLATTGLSRAMRILLLAPFNSMTFSITSALLLGRRYTTFVWVSLGVCGCFTVAGAIYTLSSADIGNLGYVLGGLCAPLLLVTLLRKDNRHKTLLREALKYSPEMDKRTSPEMYDPEAYMREQLAQGRIQSTPPVMVTMPHTTIQPPAPVVQMPPRYSPVQESPVSTHPLTPIQVPAPQAVVTIDFTAETDLDDELS